MLLIGQISVVVAIIKLMQGQQDLITAIGAAHAALNKDKKTPDSSYNNICFKYFYKQLQSPPLSDVMTSLGLHMSVCRSYSLIESPSI